MKKEMFTVFATAAVSSALMAQSFSCADFTVTGIQQDQQNPSTLQVGIEFSAEASAFANYPFIAAVTDCNGDTVATGQMFFFGQLGQTTQDYPITPTGSLDCLPLTLVFIFGNNEGETDTCFLSFGTADVSTLENSGRRISGYPNPTEGRFVLETDSRNLGSLWIIRDLTGKQIMTGRITSEQTPIDLHELPIGMYLCTIAGDEQSSLRIIRE